MKKFFLRCNGYRKNRKYFTRNEIKSGQVAHNNQNQGFLKTVQINITIHIQENNLFYVVN